MNFRNLLAAVTVAVATATSTTLAQTNVETFSFTNGLAVPDASLSGLADARSVTVLQPGWSIVDVNVGLRLSGGYNGDIYGFLTHGSGFTVLLNRSGRTAGNSFGYADAGFNITLDDAAGSDLHLYGGNLGLELPGTFQPDARNVHPLTAVDTSPRTTFLSSFNLDGGNGTWTLFLADLSSGSQSVLETWSLEISTTAIPEPTTWTLALMGILPFVLQRLQRRKRALSPK